MLSCFSAEETLNSDKWTEEEIDLARKGSLYNGLKLLSLLNFGIHECMCPSERLHENHKVLCLQ